MGKAESPNNVSEEATVPGANSQEPACQVEDAELHGWPALKAELGIQMQLFPPLSLASLGNYVLGLITIGYVGRLGELELSVAILATSIFNAAGLSILTGLAAAMETFCGQAYGAGAYRLVGVVLQRAMLLTVLVVSAVGGLLSQAGPILMAVGQDPKISQGAGRYLRYLAPALLFMGMFEAMKRYLYAQGIVRPATYVTVIALAVSPAVNYLLIYHLGLGLDGAALAVDAVQGTMAGLLGVYIIFRSWLQSGSPSATWQGWSTDALRGWGAYLKIALPSVVMLCGKWWTYEAVVIMSGLVKPPEISVGMIGIALYISSVVFQCISGIGMATSVRVSNSLGANLPRTARRATVAGLIITLVFEGVAVALVAGFHEQLPWAMTGVPSVVAAASSLLPVVALGLMGDGVNSCIQGLLRGAGKQALGAISNLASYWFFGIPLAAYLAFKLNMGAPGLWWGVVAVNTFQGMVMLVLAARLDFEGLAAKAQRQLCNRLPVPMVVEEGLAVNGAGSEADHLAMDRSGPSRVSLPPSVRSASEAGDLAAPLLAGEEGDAHSEASFRGGGTAPMAAALSGSMSQNISQSMSQTLWTLPSSPPPLYGSFT